MVLQTEFDEFKALSLILQHRALVRGLDAIDGQIQSHRDAVLSEAEATARLLPMLRTFTRALPAHFAAESRSTAVIVRESSDDVELGRQLERLDAEHPCLLALFEAAVAELTERSGGSSGAAGTVLFDSVLAELALAVEAFRRHEAEEDALFTE